MSMDLAAIPEQHDRAAQVTEQVPEKRDDLSPRDVAQVQVEVQPKAVTSRGHGEHRNDGDSVMPITMSKTRSLPDGRPGLADVGDEQESALIEKREMRASACGVFYPRPFLPLPLGDGGFVALEGTPFRLLPTPVEAVPQQRPDADWAVAHAELLANHRTDPLQRPQLGS